MRAADVPLQKLREQQLAEWNDKVHDILTQELQVAVAGPEVLQPGTENDFQIQTRNLQNANQAARLSARLIDQNDKVVYEVKEVPSDGNYRLRLPADLPLTANRHFALDVVAHRDGKLDHKVHHTLPLASTTFITHIATDKPMYRPGETVHFRSLTVERFSMKPVREPLHLQYSITSPQGAEVFQLAGNALLKGADGKLVKGPDGKPALWHRRGRIRPAANADRGRVHADGARSQSALRRAAAQVHRQPVRKSQAQQRTGLHAQVVRPRPRSPGSLHRYPRRRRPGEQQAR